MESSLGASHVNCVLSDSNKTRMQLKDVGINWVGAQTHFHLPALVHNCTVVLWYPLLYHFLFSIAVETEFLKDPKTIVKNLWRISIPRMAHRR